MLSHAGRGTTGTFHLFECWLPSSRYSRFEWLILQWKRSNHLTSRDSFGKDVFQFGSESWFQIGYSNSSDTQLNIDESPRSYAASQGSNDSEVGSHVLKLRPQCDLFGFAGF